MSDTLVERLCDLTRCKHDDLSVGAEAADEIEKLRKIAAHMYVVQAGSDDCALCGLSFRDPVHYRSETGESDE